MNIPEPEEWIGFEEAAKKCGVTKQMIYIARIDGRKSLSGATVKLEAWTTIAGWVTTEKALQDFHLRLNG